jgi:putative ABC transport system substrate-binding protein
VVVLLGVGGYVSAVAAKRATSTIPIVFGMGGDPIKAGLVDSFNRPDGNATGYTLLTNEMEPKQIGLPHELVQGVPLIGALLNPNFPPAARQLQDIEDATRAIVRRQGLKNEAGYLAAQAAFDDTFAASSAQHLTIIFLLAAVRRETRLIPVRDRRLFWRDGDSHQGLQEPWGQTLFALPAAIPKFGQCPSGFA